MISVTTNSKAPHSMLSRVPGGWRYRSARWIAAAAVVALPGAGAAQPLFDDVTSRLQSADSSVRLDALRALREAGYPEAAAPVAALLTDPVERVRLEAIETELSFFVLDWTPTRRRVGRVLELWGQQNGAQLAFDAGPSARAPLAVPPVVLTGLTATLRDRNLQVRLNATYAAGVIATTPDAALVSALIDSLTHPEREIRFAAARVLGRLAAGSAGDALIFAMNDPVDEVRYAAVEAIGEVRAERALQALEDQIAYYERGEIVILALQALARIGHPSSAPRFEGLVSDANPNVRRIAVEGMARASAPERVFELEARLATESDPAVRLAMAFALASRGRAYLDQLVDDMTRPETADLARRYMTELATSATQDLHPFLHNSNAGVRLAAADILGFVGTAADVAALEPLTRDPDTAVVSAGDLAVKRIRSRVP